MYGVIYADPPWDYRTWSEKGTGRGAVAHYRVPPFETLAAMDVAQYAAKNRALFLWATDPLLPQAFKLIEAWGFTYKTIAFYWMKTNQNGTFFTGLGHWTRANPEQCLLATRGHPKRLARNVPKLVLPRREHSRKPDEAYGLIERLVPGPYLELFARQSRTGWDSIGDEAGLFDGGPVKTRNRPSNLRCCSRTGESAGASSDIAPRYMAVNTEWTGQKSAADTRSKE